MSGQRATITVGDKVTTKTYFDPANARREIHWYRHVPWAAPTLIDADPDRGRLVIATLPIADALPDYRPAVALADLLRALEAVRVHHRDVYPANIAAGPDGPLLIDWECAMEQAAPSFDIHGPVSGVPIPDIHTALGTGYVMYWTSAHRHSIRNRWGCDVPALST